MKNSHYIYGILFILLFFSIASCGGEKIEWQGSIEEDNGIPVVKNPKEPIYTEDIVNFEEELVITEGEGKQYLFSNLIDLAVNDDETLYALDYQTADIKVFDKDGQYIKTFGKRGQGPGEFSRPFLILISQQNEVVIYDIVNRRFSYFTFEGEFIKDASTAKYNFGLCGVDSTGNILGIIYDRNPTNPVNALRKFDPDLNFLMTYVTSPYPDPQVYDPFRPRPQWTVTADDEVVYSFPKTYEIRIFDSMGDEIRKITREYDPVRVTQEMKDLVKKQAERLGDEMRLEIPEYYPPIRYISVDEKKRIFVHTSDIDEESGESNYDVFDPEGKFITRVRFPALPQVWKNKKLK